MTDAPTEETVRSVVIIDRAVRRGCVRALRANPWPVLVLGVLASAAIFALLPLGGLTWPARALVGAVVGVLAAPATLWLQGRDAGRAFPLGTRLTASLSADGLRYGIEGRQREHLWSELLLPRLRQGHLVISARRGSSPICIPPALLRDGDADRVTRWVTAAFAREYLRPPDAATEPSPPPATETETETAREPVVVDRALAHQMAADAAAADTRTRGHLLMALLVFAAGVFVVVGGDLPHLWISAAFVVVVAIRWIGPLFARRQALSHIRPAGEEDYAVTVTAAPDGCVVAIDGRETPAPWSAFRHIRTRGSAVILEGGGGGRAILPVAAFPAGLVAEGQRAVLENQP